ncbi:hypothetical protein [Streptomyces sp. NBC_01320]|uniref:hypothetical protein n=1 Tax=Streptomyces sp. NBC_01320 TaxID=2903824 RepID=UPI002E129933|nr:hypothetical protein OG395_28570 [Streptomyces sp. NBC_01320]
MAVRRRRTPPPVRFDPDFGDRSLTAARQDIVIGRWQGVRDLLQATGNAWALRTHRTRLLAHAAAGSSTVETWLAAEPKNADAHVLKAATDVVRLFGRAVMAGRGIAVDQDRVDRVVRCCLRAAEACPSDPMPWASLLTVARLYEDGARCRITQWWDELLRRDPHHMEGHTQLLRYYSARWHGTHGTMYDFARDAAGAAPPGSSLPVLVQIARVEEYRYVSDATHGRPVVAPRTGQQHWDHELAVTEVCRTWERWLGMRAAGPVPPEEVGELNYFAHAACYAGRPAEAADAFRLLDGRAVRVPWSYTGDAEAQFTRWRRQVATA